MVLNTSDYVIYYEIVSSCVTEGIFPRGNNNKSYYLFTSKIGRPTTKARRTCRRLSARWTHQIIGLNYKRSRRRWSKCPWNYQNSIKGNEPVKPKKGRLMPENQEANRVKKWRTTKLDLLQKGQEVQEESRRWLESMSVTKHDSTLLVLVSLYSLQTNFVSSSVSQTRRPIYMGDSRFKWSTQSTNNTLPYGTKLESLLMFLSSTERTLMLFCRWSYHRAVHVLFYTTIFVH
jgi:hypothetical protein